MTSLHTEVYNKILTMIQANEGIPLAWDSNTGQAISLIDEETMPPVVLELGATGSSYSDSQNLRSGAKRDRTSWEWSARVEFHGPVDTTAFEDGIAESNSYPKNTVDNIPGFIIELESLAITNPPRQDGEGGTILDMIFNVRTSRI